MENVDRLLKSPAKQRGRDFGVILACLSELGYSAEWRVVNAAQYGAAQRRRRTFIFAYRNDTIYGKNICKNSAKEIISDNGFMAKAFPIIECGEITKTTLDADIVEVSDKFRFAFENAGYMHNGEVYTAKANELEETPIFLGQILQKNVDEKYYITTEKMPKWTYLKGAKKYREKQRTVTSIFFRRVRLPFPTRWTDREEQC